MKYCKRCGRPLADAQVCDCVRAAPGSSAADYARSHIRKTKDAWTSSMGPNVRINYDDRLSFFTNLMNMMGIGEPERNATDCYERDQRIVPDCIKPNEGEVPVKQYYIAVLRSLLTVERAEGRMQVTNKRLIFRAPGRSVRGRTTLQHEYAIDEIAGIEAKMNYVFSILHLLGGFIIVSTTGCLGALLTFWDLGKSVGLGAILGILFMALGLIAFFLIPKEFMLKLAILGLSMGGVLAVHMNIDHPLTMALVAITGVVALFCLFLFFMRPNLVISIKNKTGIGEGPVDIRAASLRSRSTGYSEVMPTDETDKAIREIGAMIGDIQKFGDLGLSKWIHS